MISTHLTIQLTNKKKMHAILATFEKQKLTKESNAIYKYEYVNIT